MISVVVVSYRSAPLTARAIALLREDAAKAGELLEAVAVVNSQDPQEVRAVSEVADVTIDPGRNLGYAAGLNQGIAAARGDVLFLMNPDVSVLPGAVAALAECVRSGPLLLAGPKTYLDPEATILIPPFEEPGPLDLARRRLALEPAGARRVFARRLRRTLHAAPALWRRETLEVSAIPGALMAVSRRTIEAVGPFDEGYRLYYEENDWQRRLRRAGGNLFLVGAARAIHPYGRTTGGEPRATAWFGESERRYLHDALRRPGRGGARGAREDAGRRMARPSRRRASRVGGAGPRSRALPAALLRRLRVGSAFFGGAGVRAAGEPSAAPRRDPVARAGGRGRLRPGSR